MALGLAASVPTVHISRLGSLPTSVRRAVTAETPHLPRLALPDRSDAESYWRPDRTHISVLPDCLRFRASCVRIGDRTLDPETGAPATCGVEVLTVHAAEAAFSDVFVGLPDTVETVCPVAVLDGRWVGFPIRIALAPRGRRATTGTRPTASTVGRGSRALSREALERYLIDRGDDVFEQDPLLILTREE